MTDLTRDEMRGICPLTPSIVGRLCGPPSHHRLVSNPLRRPDPSRVSSGFREREFDSKNRTRTRSQFSASDRSALGIRAS
ncbi:hypothetical protein FA13DRAFT_709918 [Coprinellus micaceus]|uniref:Uncharacterized protein n=1 Tax=Coprinellus micaceus TaxID=71717 RepID=A0A4Y7TVH4_COPMI|nr:hypothetical protein FA13DRAFT_709918 [Coprinellus micaceus]